MYCNTNDMLHRAANANYAVPAFNILGEASARAIVETCDELGSPVILQTSTKTVQEYGVDALIGFLRPLAERAGVPVAIHLDHSTDIELTKACIDAGWSSVMMDASHCPFKRNVEKTSIIVEHARGKNVSVEGEMGMVSGIEDDIAVDEADAALATVEDSIAYTKATGLNSYAPAIGTAHGLYKREPHIDFQRFAEIRAAVDTPLVIHGGTGLAPDVFRRLIELGAAKINVSTALKLTYFEGIREFMRDNPDCNNPLKLERALYERFSNLAREHVQLFGSGGQYATAVA